MYEYITGKLAEATPTYAVVEAHGIGYFINISLKSYSEIEGKGEAKLYVHFIVREDQQTLFGFTTKLERELFRQLISVSGVGGNTARMILSTYSPRELQNIIATENAVLLKNVKGLGLKTAQKIIVELSGKMLEIGASDLMAVSTPTASRPESYDEALAALSMLGFQKSASEKVLNAIYKDNPQLGVEDAIRTALKSL
ncbi:MAG: Holliday junction branch migration protein RuvA [Alistipes sp.]|nr:Holliday junction branch migration protein RuvA [Alistipes sp.]